MKTLKKSPKIVQSMTEFVKERLNYSRLFFSFFRDNLIDYIKSPIGVISFLNQIPNAILGGFLIYVLIMIAERTNMLNEVILKSIGGIRVTYFSISLFVISYHTLLTILTNYLSYKVIFPWHFSEKGKHFPWKKQ